VSTSVDAPLAGSRAARRATVQGLVYLLIAAASWGFTWPLQKFLLTELPPFTVRASTVAVGAVVGFGLAYARRERLGVPRDQWPIQVVASMLNYGLVTVLTITALIWLPASEAVIFTYTMPIWAALLAWLAFGERLTVGRAAALVLGIGGIVVLVGGHGVEAASWAKLPGIACGLGAAWLFALGTVISKNRPPRLPPVAGVAWQVLLGAIPPVALAIFEAQDWSRVTPLGWLALLYCATVPMVFAYLAWFRALQLLPAATAAIGTLIAPVVGVTGSALLLGEPLGARQLVALALTLGGMALAVRG
jgi:drug/metabolite transporter (DMT)-like permease